MGIFEVQRRNMVENQVRPSDVTDRRILRAMLEIPREKFVAEDALSLAYSDQEVPMLPRGRPGRRRCLLRPAVLARMVQALDLDERSVVLDVGCGTGYASALLAGIAAKVFALEEDEELAKLATYNLAALSIDNVFVVSGPLTKGWEAQAPYDAILVAGAVTEAPTVLLDQLKDGGRLVAIHWQEDGVGRATRWVRDGTSFGRQPLFDAAAPILPGFERQPQFAF
jgi:protein-L-isoaspartate(D-aspartate) O-methyltransferase